MNRMIRPIILHPDARLKKKSVEVEGITDALIELAEDMMETMYHAPGIGLAAPQICFAKGDCNGLCQKRG